jgi:PBP1b-binding outer membrane lipoprotein LpoB
MIELIDAEIKIVEEEMSNHINPTTQHSFDKLISSSYAIGRRGNSEAESILSDRSSSAHRTV